jgi:hypothetical protein
MAADDTAQAEATPPDARRRARQAQIEAEQAHGEARSPAMAARCRVSGLPRSGMRVESVARDSGWPTNSLRQVASRSLASPPGWSRWPISTRSRAWSTEYDY